MNQTLFNIGEAARASGISAKMIRHYEQLGLIPRAARTLAGYRTYQHKDIHMLRFIRHSRDLGFSVKQIGDLLDLWRNQERSSSKVKTLTLEHLQALDKKIAELLAIKSQLQKLADCCQGNDRPDCPILESLAKDKL